MEIFEISLVIAISALGICLIMVMIRFIKGPTLPDRVSAFDLFSANVIGIIAITAVLADNASYLDVAIVLSLISFLGAMSFSYFITKKLEKDQEENDNKNTIE